MTATARQWQSTSDHMDHSDSEYTCGYDSDRISDLEDVEHALYSQIHYSDIKQDVDGNACVTPAGSEVCGQSLEWLLHGENKRSNATNVITISSESSDGCVARDVVRKARSTNCADTNGKTIGKCDPNNNCTDGVKVDLVNNNHTEDEYECSRYALKSKLSSTTGVKPTVNREKPTGKHKDAKSRKRLTKAATRDGGTLKKTRVKDSNVITIDPVTTVGGHEKCKNKVKKRRKKLSEISNQECLVDAGDKPSRLRDSVKQSAFSVNNNVIDLTKNENCRHEYVDVTADVSDLDEMDSNESKCDGNSRMNASRINIDSQTSHNTDSDGSSVVLLGEEVDHSSDDLVLSVTSSIKKGNSGKLRSGKSQDEKDVWRVDEADRAAPYRRNNRYFVECRNCRMNGHTEDSCPRAKKAPVCLVCGVRGHIRRQCPQAQCDYCSTPCAQHTTRCRRGLTVCARCHFKGHHTQDCPDLWRRYHATTRVGSLVKMKREVVRRECSNCGSFNHKHTYDECNRQRMYKFDMITSTPIVVSYEDLTHTERPRSQGKVVNGKLNKFASSLMKKNKPKNLKNNTDTATLTVFQNRMKSVDRLRKTRFNMNEDMCNNNTQNSRKYGMKKQKAGNRITQDFGGGFKQNYGATKFKKDQNATKLKKDQNATKFKKDKNATKFKKDQNSLLKFNGEVIKKLNKQNKNKVSKNNKLKVYMENNPSNVCPGAQTYGDDRVKGKSYVKPLYPRGNCLDATDLNGNPRDTEIHGRQQMVKVKKNSKKAKTKKVKKKIPQNV